MRAGESLKVFALKNRAALHRANDRIEFDCAAQYNDVRRDFGNPNAR